MGVLSDVNLDVLLREFPDAVDVREAGRCHCKHRAQMYFFWLPSLGDDRARGDMVDGGVYCPVCKYSNAGVMDKRQYESSPVVRP